MDSALSPQRELRPRLCAMKRGPNGYGFNLHSDKSKPGQFIRSVDPDSPAEASGLQAQDRIIEVMPLLVPGRLHPRNLPPRRHRQLLGRHRPSGSLVGPDGWMPEGGMAGRKEGEVVGRQRD